MSDNNASALIGDEQVNLSALLDLYSNVSVLFCVAESTGYFTLLNPYWTKVLGWSLDELKAKPFIEFVHPDDRNSTDDQADKQFVENEAVNSFINRYIAKDGSYRWLEWTARSPDGGMLYAVAHDITDKVENEHKLKLVQDRLQELVQNAPGAFFQYIIHDDGTHSVQYMSPGSVDIWGLTPEQIGADPSVLWEMILPEDIEPLQKSIELSLQSLSRWEQEYRIKLPSGEIRWLRGVGNPRKIDSGGTFWNSLVMDMTVLREQQNTISRMQRMEMIGHLASGVSHDFNNILAIIDGHRQLIGMKTTEPSLLEHCEVMNTAINRARQLTKRLLMSSKKKIVPTGQPIDVTESLHDIRSLMDEITPANISVTWDVDTSCNATVESSEFDDVVTNLFINARNALGEQGRICIEMKPAKQFKPDLDMYVHLKPANAMRYSVLSVRDNGCGIARSEFEKIFIPFVSHSNTGTGLGLAMAVGFASRNQCGITLESIEGKGTSISIWIPERNLNSTPAASKKHQTEISETYRIVVIDDEAEVLRVVGEMLKLKGHTVTTFSDSAVARQWILDNRSAIDLVLADEVMPGEIQGHDIYNEFDSEIPVLVMSGFLDVKHFDLETVEVLQKPVSLDTLQHAIYRVMQ